MFAKQISLFTFSCFFLHAYVFAQPRQMATGKKIKVLVNSTNQSTSGNADEQIAATISYNLWQDFEVQSVTTQGYSMKYTLKRVNGSVDVLGDKRTYDSDDSLSKKLPEMAPVFQLINQPQLITIKNDKSSQNNSSFPSMSSSFAAMNNADVEKLYLSLPDDQLKLGNSWTDSINLTNGKLRTDYFIVDTAHQKITISLIMDANINGNMQQAGNGMGISMKSFARATRIYDRVSGWLIKETANIETVGASSMSGNNIPLMMKISLVTTVL
jgi:hypothetical protein